jgi:hypothetical protein
MDQDLDRLRRAQSEGLYRLGCRAHVVIPTRYAEGEILPQIADAGRASGQDGGGVFD